MGIRVGHVKRDEGVRIDRASPWGNPFSHIQNSKAVVLVGSVEEAIQRYDEWLTNSLSEAVRRDDPHFYTECGQFRTPTIAELQRWHASNTMLLCWCIGSGHGCHGEVIAEHADHVFG